MEEFVFQGQNVIQPGSVLSKPTEKQEEGGGNTILEERLLPRMTGARSRKSRAYGSSTGLLLTLQEPCFITTNARAGEEP